LPSDRSFQFTDLTLGGGCDLDTVGQAVTSLTQFGAQLGEGLGAFLEGFFASR